MTAYPISGTAAYAQFGWESTYGTKVTCDKAFGLGVKLNVSRKNNMERVYGLGARNATTTVPKQYEGNFSADFVMSSPWFLRAFTGAAPVKTGGGPYTYTYSESNTVGSFTIENGFDLDVDRAIFLDGCKCNTMTITGAVNELAKVKIDGNYKTEEKSDSLTSVAVPGEEAFVFQQGTLQYPSGTTLADVQSCEITMTNNNEPIYGLGSRFNTSQVPKQREYNVRVTLAFEDPTKILDLFYGATGAPAATVAEQATLILTFTNGLGTTNLRSITFNFADLKIDDESINLDPNEVIKEDVTIFARTLTSIVAINNTTSEP